MTFTALSIAGSDPSGGAGIQADLKTFVDHRVYGMAVLTGLTVQNTRGVFRVEPVEPGLVHDQIRAILSDLPIGAIKIGMLPSPPIAQAVAAALTSYEGPLVIDPLLFASDGTRLGPHPRDFDALFNHATVVTPNEPECIALLGKMTPQVWTAERQVALLMTGGHGHGDSICDRLHLPNGQTHAWSNPRVHSKNTHGTGCTLSAAICANLAHERPLIDAVTDGITYVHQLLAHASHHQLGSGTGPLLHGQI